MKVTLQNLLTVISPSTEGYLEDGSDLPLVPRATYEFQVGVSEVIAGWTLGVVGMCVGERRRLTIPPHLAYGENPGGPLGDNAVLVFDILLTNCTDGLKAATLDVESGDTNNNGKIDAHELPALFINYLKESFQTFRRGGFIQNGTRTTFK